ncbi:MAG TPA: PorP/SprF family type IX secretion system membrane protein [Bacteroidia bacterium]|nr:PorP/SprF family type IX secretion system membrane protein [Bacteroidia bacterium]
MRTKRKIISAVILSTVLIPVSYSYGQDIHFSQLTETQLLLNPAEAALGHDVLGVLNYKDQWKSVSALSAYKTFNVSADMAVLKNDKGSRLGVGLNFFNDKAGDAGMTSTTGNLHLSGVIAANDANLISAGIYGGFGQRTLQYDQLNWDAQYDGMHYNATLPTGEQNQAFANHNYMDIGAGMAWFYGKGHSTLSSNDAFTLNLGFSVHHLNQPVYSFYGANAQKLPMQYVAHGSADFGLKNYNIILEPTYLVMIQSGHHEVTGGMLFKFLLQDASKYTGRKKPSDFGVGGYYRYGDALIIDTRYEFSGFSLGLSYDVNLSDLKAASRARGGFEISLRYMNPSPFSKGSSSALF